MHSVVPIVKYETSASIVDRKNRRSISVANPERIDKRGRLNAGSIQGCIRPLIEVAK